MSKPSLRVGFGIASKAFECVLDHCGYPVEVGDEYAMDNATNPKLLLCWACGQMLAHEIGQTWTGKKQEKSGSLPKKDEPQLATINNQDAKTISDAFDKNKMFAEFQIFLDANEGQIAGNIEHSLRRTLTEYLTREMDNRLNEVIYNVSNQITNAAIKQVESQLDRTMEELLSPRVKEHFEKTVVGKALDNIKNISQHHEALMSCSRTTLKELLALSKQIAAQNNISFEPTRHPEQEALEAEDQRLAREQYDRVFKKKGAKDAV